jgi:hypothetical protein
MKQADSKPFTMFQDARTCQRIEREAHLNPITWAQVTVRSYNTKAENIERLTRLHDKLAANLRRVEEWGKTEGRSKDEIRVARTYYRQTLAFFQRCDGLLDYLGKDKK